MDLKNNENKFNDTLSNILSTILPVDKSTELSEISIWLNDCILYNVPHGKRTRGLAVPQTVKMILDKKCKNYTDEDMELARVLGWTIEFLQAAFIVIDDIMDQSITRRGKPCWYKLDHVGLISCNDSNLLEQEMYNILKIYFHDKHYYQKLVDLMHKVASRMATYGQCMDMLSNPINEQPDLIQFTSNRYATIVKHKTAFYSFVLPVRLAMYMTSCDSLDDHKSAETILLKIGYLFQMQDDYLDCFGDPDTIGKIGTDIQEGKCCWPIVKALEMCDQNQRQTLDTNYGINDEKYPFTENQLLLSEQ
ncbi:unnamed protein product, partial [Oppiella nova]